MKYDVPDILVGAKEPRNLSRVHYPDNCKQDRQSDVTGWRQRLRIAGSVPQIPTVNGKGKRRGKYSQEQIYRQSLSVRKVQLRSQEVCKDGPEY